MTSTAPTVTLSDVASTALAEQVGIQQVVDPGIRPLWDSMPRLAGPVYAVRCAPDDHLMLHAAIYRAPAGSVLLVESQHGRYAVAGGNVCAIAQRRGIAGFVVDGFIRDIDEVREAGFPVFARGLCPKPAAKKQVLPQGDAVVGGVLARTGDLVVADIDGVVVLPADGADSVVEAAWARQRNEATHSLDDWEAAHRRKVAEALEAAGADATLPA